MSKNITDGISHEKWDLAYKKFQIIRPFLEEGVQIAEIAKNHGIAESTAWRWVKNCRQFGITGLSRKTRSKSGINVSGHLLKIIEGLALKTPRLSVASIQRAIKPVAAKNNEPIPSYSTIYRVVQAIDPSLLELAHNGINTYMDKYDLVHRTEAERPNAIWQADHTFLDVLVKDGKKLRKPWLTIVLDDYSRAIAGYAVSFSAPSAIQTALAFRHAIWHKPRAGWDVAGIPNIFYTDHGSDFTSRHIEQLTISLKTRLIFSVIGQPRGRGKIERFFRSLSQILLPTLPGYQPPGTKTKDKEVLTLPQLAARIEDYIVNDYHQKAHGTTKISPYKRWSTDGFLPRMPENLSELDILLLTVPDNRTVQKDGISFSGFKYIHPTLAGYIGAKVSIRYDPRDVAEISVFDHDKFICCAVCTDLAGDTVSLSEIQNARKRQIREHQLKIKDRTKATDDLLDFRTLTDQEMLEVQKTAPALKKPSKLKRYHNDE